MSATIFPYLGPPAPAPTSPEARIVAGQGKVENQPNDDTWPGDPEDLLDKIVIDFEESELSSLEARELSLRDRSFRDGIQWTAEEVAILRRRRQPIVTNNVIGRKVDLLIGMERRGRSDPEAFPRTPSDNIRADAATQALRYICDEQRYDVVRSSVYENMLVEGYGGAEVLVAPQTDGAGYDVIINHIPWSRLYYDPHSEHPGFSDALFLGVVLWLDYDVAIDMWPDSEDILDATLFASRSETYEDKPRNMWGDYKRRRVRVIQHHWKKRNDWWSATLTRSGFLEDPMMSPYKDRHGNRSCPLIMRSARMDRENNRFGIVRDMVPLQEEINKRRSRLLHALSVNQVVMEEGAVSDVDQTRREVAKPDGVIITNRGFEFKFQKDQADIEGQMHLLQDAVEQMQQFGPNAAMAGKGDPREQSGRAIIAQQSGGQMENEPLSDALRQFTHKIMEACWCRVRQFWTEERWVRVTNDDKNTRFVGLNHSVTIAELLSELDQTQPLQAQIAALPPGDQAAIQAGMQMPQNDPRLQTVVRIDNDLNDLDVSITAEEGPDNPTMAAEQFQQIMSLPPMVLQQFPPEFFIQASSLRNKDALLRMLEDHQQQQAQNTQHQQATQQAMATAKVAQAQASANDKQAQATERLHGIAMDHAAMNASVPQPGSPIATGAVSNPLIPEAQAGMAQPTSGLVPPQADQATAVDPLGMGNQALQAQSQGHDQQMAQANLALKVQAQDHAQRLDRAKLVLSGQQAQHARQNDMLKLGLASRTADRAHQMAQQNALAPKPTPKGSS